MIEFKLTPDSPYGLSDVVGTIPFGLSEDNPDTAIVQLDESYRHGGGWSPMKPNKWKLGDDNSIQYPGDPKMKPWAVAKLHDDIICVYESAWVAVIRPDRSFEVSRMD